MCRCGESWSDRLNRKWANGKRKKNISQVCGKLAFELASAVFSVSNGVGNKKSITTQLLCEYNSQYNWSIQLV